MSKIASKEATAMNRLYASEATRVGLNKSAAEEIQAFKDHEEYVETLESVLKEDSKESEDPNGVYFD